MVLKIDPAQVGLLKAFKTWELHALNYLWESEDPAGSKKVHDETTKRYQTTDDRPISRASIINFLNDMVEEGILGVRFETCKGGQRGLYYPLLNKDETIGKIFTDLIDSLNRDFPGMVIITSTKDEILEAIRT